MPLQWLPLQKRTPVSEALTPQRGRTTTVHDYSFLEREAAQQEAEARRKHELKLMDKQIEMTKLTAGLKEDTAKGMTTMPAGQLLGREPTAAAAPTLTKENMPEAAMEIWKFISTLEPESQKFFIQQLKEKEQPTGYIEAGEKRVEVPGSVGMYGHLVDQGLIDPTTDTVIEKKPEEMKGRFNIEEGFIYDTTTGERKKLSIEEPEKAIEEINAEANAYGLKMAATGTVSFEDAKNDYFVDNKVDEEIAAELSKVKKIPKELKDSSLWDNFINWIKGKKGPAVTEKGWQPKGAGKGAFDETNVSALVTVISDDVTTAERAHLKGQGASDADIDEAIRRKGE